MSFIHDHSGKVFKKKGCSKPTLKDLQSNPKVRNSLQDMSTWFLLLDPSLVDFLLLPGQVIAAILNASKGQAYFSKVILTSAILEHYSKRSLYPDGLKANNPSIQEWAAKMGEAAARLVACPLHGCMFPLLTICMCFPSSLQCPVLSSLSIFMRRLGFARWPCDPGLRRVLHCSGSRMN